MGARGHRVPGASPGSSRSRARRSAICSSGSSSPPFPCRVAGRLGPPARLSTCGGPRPPREIRRCAIRLRKNSRTPSSSSLVSPSGIAWGTRREGRWGHRPRSRRGVSPGICTTPKAESRRDTSAVRAGAADVGTCSRRRHDRRADCPHVCGDPGRTQATDRSLVRRGCERELVLVMGGSVGASLAMRGASGKPRRPRRAG